MQIITLNVGQGHLSIVRNRTRAFIVDAHIPANDGNYEFVKAALSEVLSQQGDTLFVEGLLLTGLDKDHAHAQGVGWILQTYRPNWVAYPKYKKDTENATETFKRIEAARLRMELQRFPVRLDTLEGPFYKTEGFGFEFFSPHKEDLDSSNNGSIVARVTSRDGSPGSVLITGDTELSRWERIHRMFGTRLRADVLQAPHHGANNGAHEPSIAAIAPHTVHVSAGYHAQYNHPHPEAMALYRRHAKRVWCTQQGTIHTSLSRGLNGAVEVTSYHVQLSR